MERLIVKVVLWRAISVVVTIIAALAFLGNIKSATIFSVFLHIALTVLNYGFELCWERYKIRKENDSYSR